MSDKHKKDEEIEEILKNIEIDNLTEDEVEILGRYIDMFGITIVDEEDEDLDDEEDDSMEEEDRSFEINEKGQKVFKDTGEVIGDLTDEDIKLLESLMGSNESDREIGEIYEKDISKRPKFEKFDSGRAFLKDSRKIFRG